MYLNKVFLIGNLTRDPELKTLPSGTPVASFGLATNRVWTDKEGGRKEQTDYHNIVVFGRQAETTSQYLKKGAMAYVEGRLTTRSWDAQDGTKRYRTEVIAERVQFGPRGSGSAPQGGGGGKSAPAEVKGEELETIQYPDAESEGINPNDIPF